MEKTAPLRSVSAGQSSFATEQFIDELAHAAKLDPVDFRRRNLNASDPGRWSGVQ